MYYINVNNKSKIKNDWREVLSMNKIIVTGNLTKDMEVEITSNDKVHGKLTVANNVGYGENQKTNFLNCDLYGQRVDTLSKY